MPHVVIMAGGSGTRLWPESRARCPKQLLRLGGDRTLLEATLDRVRPLVDGERITLATTAELARPILDSLHGRTTLQNGNFRLLVEPLSRNTAPCIGLAAVHIARQDPEATLLVLPADHIIAPDDAFHDAIRWAEQLVQDDPDRLILLGIRPAHAATGFGYIQRGERLLVDRRLVSPLADATFDVRAFREKPDTRTAESYLASGAFYWNSGIFCFRAATILEQFARFEPAIHLGLTRIADTIGTPAYEDVLRREFADMRSVSIDYAIMERAAKVAVIEAPFQWDDVGSWSALARFTATDSEGNTLDAARCVAIDSRGTIVRSRDPERVIALCGTRDLVIIDTPDALLVVDRRDEQAVRRVVEELHRRGWSDVL